MAESYTPPGSSTAYTVPELTDPADAPQAFRDFADSVQNVADMLTVSDHLADVTLAAGDEGTMLSVDTMTAGADVTVTVPDNATVPLPVGFTVAVANVGGGGFKVKLAKGPGVIIQDQGFLQVEDYRITTLVKISTDFWLVQAGSATYTPPSGPQAAAISSPAPTGQYTDVDGTWDYYEFTVSGTLTVDREGLADVLVVGGGGGAFSASNVTLQGGGGGGGVRYGGFVIQPGSYSVTVGAGGAGNTAADRGVGSPGGTSSVGGVVTVGGGGPGAAFDGAWLNVNGVGGGGSPGGAAGTRNTGAASIPGGGAGGPGAQGLTLNYTGTPVEYGAGGSATTGGNGATGSTGNDGIVIVKVKA